MHYHLHKILPCFHSEYNLSTGDTLTIQVVGIWGEFILTQFTVDSLGIAGIGGHDVIEHGMEFCYHN